MKAEQVLSFFLVMVIITSLGAAIFSVLAITYGSGYEIIVNEVSSEIEQGISHYWFYSRPAYAHYCANFTVKFNPLLYPLTSPDSNWQITSSSNRTYIWGRYMGVFRWYPRERTVAEDMAREVMGSEFCFNLPYFVLLGFVTWLVLFCLFNTVKKIKVAKK